MGGNIAGLASFASTLAGYVPRVGDVVTALDLDGGTSTTLYANGQLVYPTARAERLVSTSLLVVQNQ